MRLPDFTRLPRRWPRRTPRAWRGAACALLLGVVATLAFAAPVSAADVLVSNIGAGTLETESLASLDLAQRFTTGNLAATLESVEIPFHSAPSGVSVKIASGVSSSSDGTVVATLTNPSSLTAGTLTFTAPANTKLSAGTNYWVVVEGTSGQIRLAHSNAEDAGARPGWSIANTSRNRSRTVTGSWPNVHTASVRIRVNGSLNPPPKLTGRRGFNVATVNGSTLTVGFNHPLNTGTSTPGSAFEVTATPSDGTARTIDGTGTVAVSGVNATVTLASAVAEGETVTVSYTPPEANRLWWAEGDNVGGFSGRPVINRTDATPPNVAFAQVNGTTLTLYYDDRLKHSAVPTKFNFWVQKGEGSPAARPFGNPSVFSNTVTIQLFNSLAPAKHGQTVRFAYDLPSNAANRIQDRSGNQAPAIAQWADIDNVTPPALVSAVVRGAALILTFDGEMEEDGELVPPASAFTVRRVRSGTTTTVDLVATNPVAVSGRTVTLSLAEAVLHTDTVHVRYDAPTTGARLRDDDNYERPVSSFPNRQASNLTPGASIGSPPQFSSAAVNGSTLNVTFNEPLQTGSSHRPPNSAFAVIAKPLYGTARTIASAAGNVSISGSTVTVTLAAEVERGESVAVGYTEPSTNFLRGTNGFHANSFSGQPAANNSPGSPAPTFASASYSYPRGGIVVNFTGPFLGCADRNAWIIKVDGAERYPQVARCEDRAVLLIPDALSLRPAVEAARRVTVSYSRGVAEAMERSTPLFHPPRGSRGPSARLRGTDGSVVESFDDQTVSGLKPRLVPPPTVDGSTLVLTFDEDLDPGATPGPWLFHVTVNDERRSVARDGVAVSGKTVTLTLASAVATGGDTVTVRYTQPDGCWGHCSWGLRGASHIAVDTFPDQAVTNNSTPVFSVDENTLTLTFDQNLDAASKPSPGAFRVTVNNARRSVASGGVAVSGKTVTLTLASPVAHGDTVRVRYTRPSARPLQGAAGTAVGSFADQAVTNNTPEGIFWRATLTVKITVVSTLRGCFGNTECSDSLTDASFTHGGTTYQVTNAYNAYDTAQSRWELTLSLDNAIPEDLTLYVGGDEFAVTDATLFENGKLATWAAQDYGWLPNQQVSLRLTAPVPSFQSAAVDENTLTLTFDQNLDAASKPSPGAFRVTVNNARRSVASGGVAVSGKTVTLTLASPVAHGDTVRVRYTRPSARPLQGAAGIAVGSFADQAVTNNTPEGIFWRATLTVKITVVSTIRGCFGSTECSDSLTDASFTHGGTTYQVTNAYNFYDTAQSRWQLTLSLDNAIPEDLTLYVGGDEFAVTDATLSDSGKSATWAAQDYGWLTNQQVSLRLTAPVPSFQSAAVDENTLTLTFDQNLDAASKPSPGAFRVTVNNARRSVASGGVAVSGKTVTLTLASPVAHGDTVRVRYTRPSARPLQGAAGTAVGSFADQAVTNNTPEGIFWRATLTVKITVVSTLRGCFGNTECSDSLTDASFTHGGTTYQVTNAYNAYDTAQSRWELTLSLDNAIPEDLTLYVGGDEFAVTDATLFENGKLATWAAQDYGWLPNQQVSLRLTAPVPSFQSAAVDENTLTLTFDQNLDAASKPSPGAFRVTVNNARRSVASGGVAVSGKTVTLTLASPVAHGDTVRVRYTRPSARPLQGAAGIAVGSFADQAVTNNTPEGIFWRATLTVKITVVSTIRGCFGSTECSDSLTDASFTHGGTTYQVTNAYNFYDTAQSRWQLTLSLDNAIPEDLTLYVGGDEFAVTDATLSDSGKSATWAAQDYGWLTNQQVSLRLTEGSGTSGGSGLIAPDEEQVPDVSVTGVSVVSDPGADHTYGLGDTIQVQVTFNRLVVDVDTSGGTPRLKIDMDPAEWGEKWATYQGGSGTANLIFTHTVVEPNISTQGIAVLENTLELNGGTIRSDGEDAGLAHTGLAHNADHKVDWQASSDSGEEEGGASGGSGPEEEQAAPASVTRVSVSSSPQAGATYRNGETIQVSVTFGEPVDVDTSAGTPRLKIDMDPAEWGEKWAGYASGTGTATLTFTHTVVEPNISTQGIAVLENTLELNGGAIRSDGAAAGLAHAGLDHNPDHKVDWRPVAPEVDRVEITSNPGSDDTYADGDVITVSVTFDEAVDVDTSGGTPRLKIDMDPAEWGEKWAGYASGSGTTTLTFTHTVVEPNLSTQGIAVLENSLALNGGGIESKATDAAADLSHDGLAHNANHKVDWQASSDSGGEEGGEEEGGASGGSGPEEEQSEPPANSAATGAPAITGTARVGETLTADTSGIADADGLTGASFSYQWLADGSDISGATGSTYTPASADVGKAVKVRVSFTDDGGHAETLTSAATAPVAAANPPDVTAVEVTSDPGDDDTYRNGDVITVSVTFDEAVDVDTSGGAPRLKIDMDPAEWGEKWASYASGSGSGTLTFTHTVVEPNISTQGIAVLANSLALNGGGIESKATDTDANLSHDGLAHDANHKVDWRTPAPTVESVEITSDPGSDDTYGLGDVITISVTFSEAVDVTGSPQLSIDMDPAEWGTKQAAYQGGSGTKTLTFTHTVVEPNYSTQGIAVLANTMALNGGDIESKASDTDADLSHDGLAHNANHKVDWQQ